MDSKNIIVLKECFQKHIQPTHFCRSVSSFETHQFVCYQACQISSYHASQLKKVKHLKNAPELALHWTDDSLSQHDEAFHRHSVHPLLDSLCPGRVVVWRYLTLQEMHGLWFSQNFRYQLLSLTLFLVHSSSSTSNSCVSDLKRSSKYSNSETHAMSAQVSARKL